jgi:hypothetical protein
MHLFCCFCTTTTKGRKMQSIAAKHCIVHDVVLRCNCLQSHPLLNFSIKKKWAKKQWFLRELPVDQDCTISSCGFVQFFLLSKEDTFLQACLVILPRNLGAARNFETSLMVSSFLKPVPVLGRNQGAACSSSGRTITNIASLTLCCTVLCKLKLTK